MASLTLITGQSVKPSSWNTLQASLGMTFDVERYV